jgi:hypothetical protein
MPYYASNRIFMPRNDAFRNRVLFDRTGRRRQEFTLRELTTMAVRVSCEQRQPVLLAIGYPDFRRKEAGIGYPAYKGMSFTWDEASRARLGRPVADFPHTTSDESYAVYEVDCATYTTTRM